MVTSVSTIILAAIVHALLQLSLGCLLLLYHASKGKHIAKKTRGLVRSYVFGIGALTFLGVCAMCYLILHIWEGPLAAEWLTIIVGILAVLTFMVWLFYYRWGRKSSELWLPRTVARFIDGRAKSTDSRVEAFSLGILTCFAELPFSLILFVVAANSVLELPTAFQVLMVLVYAIVTIIPTIILCCNLRTGKTIVEVQRWRVRHKNFLRVVTGLGFLALAIFIFAFRIKGVL